MMASKQVELPMAEAVISTVETPPSLQAAIAARKPEVLLDTPKDFFRSMRVRNQLLLGYGMMAMLSFGALIGICTTLTTVVSNTVISVSTRELTFQIVNNSKATMQETALVLDARLSEGFSVLVQPTAFALFDLIGGDSSLTPLISYGEPSTSELKPPLSYDDRWHCVSTVNDATTGCNSVTRKQQISLGASSVYITGSSTSGDGFDTADAATWLHINRSTVVDLFVKNAWKDMEAWLDVYIAGLSSSAMLRQYPGSVGNLETASVGSTTRTYDPSSKGWYTDVAPADGSFKLAEKTTGEYLEQRPRTISSPYLSDFGRGYLLSVSGPLAGPSGTVEGVIGADIAVNSLQSLVTTIKSRETGEAHFFERATGLVVASRQLDASFTVTKIPTINDLTLPGENNKHTIRQLTDPAEGAPVGGDGYSLLTDANFVFDAAGGGSMSRVDPDGAEYQLVWQQAWDGNFVLLTVTPTEEIQRPISSQLTRIRAYSTNTILVSLFLCLGCLVVVVLLVIRMSVQISKPIVDTVRQSNLCVRNIGSNLFEGITIEGAPEGKPPKFIDERISSIPQVQEAVSGIFFQYPGEVAALRGEFLKALFMLNKKRVREPAQKTPFTGLAVPARGLPEQSVVQATASPPYATIVANLQQERSDTIKEREAKALEPPNVQPMNKWNRTVSKIGAWLLLPIMIAMVVVIGVTTGWIASGLQGWLAPVKAQMVKEELANLNVRAYERAQLTEAFINSAAGSLTVLHDFATTLSTDSSDTAPISTPRMSYLSPTGAHCATMDTTGAASYFSCTDLELQTGPRPPTTRNNYKASAVYKPPSVLPSDTKTSILGSTLSPLSVEEGSGEGYSVSAVTSAWAKEQLLMSQLDQAMSAVFFASDITYAYVGFHNTEVYRQFPYMDLKSFIEGDERTCDAVPAQKISAFSPICRPWYANALKSTASATTYNSVANDAANPGTMFLSLSRRIEVGSSLVGVAAVDVGLAALANKLNLTKLYRRGFAMVWDSDGLGVVHKNYIRAEFSNKGPLPIEQLDAVGDTEFEQKWKTNCLDKGRVVGNWSAVWRTPDGGYETWYYSYRPVPNTPYMIALTVVEQEVTEIPNQAEERQMANVTLALWTGVLICLCVVALLFAFTWWLNRRFATPILKLVKIISEWGKSDFQGGIDAEDAAQSSSLELSVLLQNFKKMLIALRFGSDKWATGSQRKVAVMENNLSACELVRETGNERGMGIVLNNVALACGDSSVADAFPQLEASELWPAAISAASSQVQAHPSDMAMRDTLAMRLLNCTLWHMRADPPRPEEAAAVLSQVVVHCTNVRTMAIVASHVSSEMLASGGDDGTTKKTYAPHPEILSAISMLIGAALTICSEASLPFDESDIIADLAAAHCDIGCTWMTASDTGTMLPMQFCQPPQLAMWAISSVPTISERTLIRLCLHAKAGAAKDGSDWIDRVASLTDCKFKGVDGTVELGSAVARWRKASGSGSVPTRKAMMLVLDLSFSMDDGTSGNTRLEICKRSIDSILRESIAPNDRCGLVSFANDVRVEFPLQEAGPADGAASRSRLETVRSLRTRGMTAFYSAVLKGALDLEEQLAAEPTLPKWLVALTDGADNKSNRDDRLEIPKVLKRIPGINLALITVGNDVDIKTCNTFLEAVTDAGGTAMLVKATDAASIAAAFQNVAEAMSAGVAEVL